MAATVARQVVTRTRRRPVPSADPLLASKITAPVVPGWAVQRPRVTRLISRGTRWCPLTVVTGPPGAGKTMAMALWAVQAAGPVAWVSLDKHDNRPGAFWSYVVAALRRAGVVVPRALAAMPRGRAAEHLFLLRLASALAAQNPPVTLVLDDVHLLTDPRLLNGLDFLLRNVGPGLRLMVTSRMDPLLPLHRYRVAGQVTEIRASELAFTTAEAGLLLSQHRCTLSRNALECLTRRTEGWAAGLRLAAMSIGTHSNPDIFIKELTADDSALTGYLMEEALNAQPPEVRDILLSTSILHHVSAEAATELTGSARAAGAFLAMAHANAFIQPLRGGRYRYHTLFAEVLRLKLRREHPDQIACLHRRAALWYQRNGQLTDAVRHAAQAADWQLASRMVIDGLAIGELFQPQGNKSLADEFAAMPHNETWIEPQPYLISATIELSAGRLKACATTLAAAEEILEQIPADEKAPCRLAAALIRLTVSRRSGDLTAAVAAAARAEALVSQVAGSALARSPGIRAYVLSGRGTVELGLGHLDEAARVLDAAINVATDPGAEHERADCLGHLALVEAMRGRLCRAAELATEATAGLSAGEQRPPALHPNPAALVALAWVHLERNELREARRRLTHVDAALAVIPDKLIGAVGCLVAARASLAEGRADLSCQFVVRARSGWTVPAWLEQMLILAEARASVAAGDAQAALAAAERTGNGDTPEAAVMLAQAWAAAGDTSNARRTLAPALAANGGAPATVRLQARLVDAQLSYGSGDRTRGHRSLASALQLARREQVRLPFVLERGWIGPVLRNDPKLAHAHQHLFAPALRPDRLTARSGVTDRAPVPAVVEPLTEREREVLRYVSGMLSTAEVASEMYVSINTVKSHLKSIYRKLAATHRGEAVRRARQLEMI